MQEVAISVTHIQEAPTSTTVYSTVSNHNYNFRILNTEFQRNTLLLYYTCFIWLAVAFSAAVLILSHSLHQEPYPFFVTLGAAWIPLSVLAIYKRQIYGINLAVSTVLFNLIVIALAALLSLHLPYSGVAFGVYLAVETISNCCMMENSGKILLKALLLVQLLIICLKIDKIILIQWKQSLFGLTIIFLFLLVVALSILAYSLLISFLCVRENYHEIKAIGLIFLALNLLSASFIMAIPIWAVFINESYQIPTMAALISSFFTIVYSFFKRTQIALFLCKTLQIATKNNCQFQLKNKDTSEMPHLFRVSENWFVEKYDPSTCQSKLEPEECVACMDSKADTVWQPCGHCTLCNRCMRQLLSTQITNCPLCKAQPSSIVRIGKRDEFSGIILGANEYQITECIGIEHF